MLSTTLPPSLLLSLIWGWNAGTLYIYPIIIIILIIYCNTRIQLAALHFNENANREQAVSQAGEPRYDLVFPKYKKGGYVVKKITKDPTYGNNGYGDQH